MEPERVAVRQRLLHAVAALPYISASTFYLFIILWRFHLGRWPTYGNPDAGAFKGTALIVDKVIFVILGLGFGSCLFLAPAAVASFNASRRWVRLPVLFGLGGCFLLLALFWFDPGGFFEWYVD